MTEDDPQNPSLKLMELEVAPGVFMDVPDSTTPQQAQVFIEQYRQQMAPKPPGMLSRAAGALREVIPSLPGAFPGPMGQMATRAVAQQGADIVEQPRRALPILGGMAAAALTGGASVPVQIGATALGGMIGKAGEIGLEGTPFDAEAAKRIALEGGLQGGLQGVGAGLKVAGPALKRAGVGLYQKALKPNAASLLRIPGGVKAGPEEMARRVSETLINRGTIRRGTATKIADEKEALLAEADRLAQQSPAQVNPAIPESYAQPLIKDYADVNARRELAQARRPVTETATNPRLTDPIVDYRTGQVVGQKYKRAIPIQEAIKQRQMQDRLTRGSYGGQRLPETEARKALAAGWREEIGTAEPAIREQTRQVSNLIPAEDALERALWRAGNVNPITLPEAIAGSSALSGQMPLRSLARVSGIMLNRPLIGSALARGMYKTGEGLSKQNLAQLVRALLLAELSGEQEPEQPR